MRPTLDPMNLARFLAGIFLSLLPERYRSRFGWGFVSPPSAVTSGVVELVASLGILLYRYIRFADMRVLSLPSKVTLGAAEQGGETGLMGLGLFVLAEYLLQPMTLLVVYFVIEGFARAAAGIVSGEIVPTLPLQLLSMAHFKAAAAKKEHDLGPLVEDMVQPGAGEFALCIASCRPKPWTRMSTISYNDVLYELASEERAQSPRCWVYVLRKRPESKIIRGEVYLYRPDELLEKAPDVAAAAAP